jgi:hypothetical protein
MFAPVVVYKASEGQGSNKEKERRNHEREMDIVSRDKCPDLTFECPRLPTDGLERSQCYLSSL